VNSAKKGGDGKAYTYVRDLEEVSIEVVHVD
jgi:hypothetical protein